MLPSLIAVPPLAFSGRASSYPGAAWLAPRIHHSPDCLHKTGWHDVAGALTFKGTHHVFQGCPASGGWSHASSTDLVHWKDLGLGPVALNETFAGMESDITPCSGFAAVNDDGVPCAGFRQCGSSKGTTELNPAAHAWDVPMEVRCATDELLTTWSVPQWWNPIYYYRALPYDPVRPWKDTDGKWYYGLSTDGCNATTKNTPCAAGGQLELFTADSFMGPWTQLAPMFTTNTTVSGGKVSPGAITREFVTSGYFGALPGDPAGGKTRVLTQNNGGPTYWVGAQSNGGPFRAYWDRPGAVGHYDYGSLTMARTLGGDPDQVVGAGRKVLVGWIGCAAPRRPTEHKPGAKQKPSAASPPCVARTETFASIATALLCHSREPRGTVRRSGGNRASQSLGRDLSLSSGYELLQQFVPELAGLRGKHTRTSAVGAIVPASMQLEVIATFKINVSSLPSAVFGVDVLANPDGGAAVSLFVDCSAPAADADCHVHMDASAHGGTISTGPLLFGHGEEGLVRMHAIVDHSIVELIVNNRTAIVGAALSPAEADAGIKLFGAGVDASMEYWELAAAA